MKKYSGKQSPDERKVPSTGAIFNAVWTRTWSSNSLKVRMGGCSEFGTSKAPHNHQNIQKGRKVERKWEETKEEDGKSEGLGQQVDV